MADKNGTVNAGDAPKKGSMGTILLLIPTLLVGFGGGGTVMMNYYPEIMTAVHIIFQVPVPVYEEEPEEPEEFGVFHEMEPIIVNPRNSGGQNVLSCKVGLEGRDEKILAEVESKLVVIRAAITQIFSEHTIQELSDVDYRAELRDKVKEAVNEIMDPVVVDRVYFTTFILQ